MWLTTAGTPAGLGIISTSEGALETRRATIASVTAFEKEHHLITQIARAKESFVYQPAPRNP